LWGFSLLQIVKGINLAPQKNKIKIKNMLTTIRNVVGQKNSSISYGMLTQEYVAQNC
jgi:hypothetical protein